MKILVTGGAGFIGSALIRLAILRGYSVVNVDMLTYAACLENLASVADSPNYAFEQVDIRDRIRLEAVFSAHSPDVVMPGMFLCVPITVIIMIVCSYFPSSRPIAILLSGDGNITEGAKEQSQLNTVHGGANASLNR